MVVGFACGPRGSGGKIFALCLTCLGHAAGPEQVCVVAESGCVDAPVPGLWQAVHCHAAPSECAVGAGELVCCGAGVRVEDAGRLVVCEGLHVAEELDRGGQTVALLGRGGPRAPADRDRCAAHSVVSSHTRPRHTMQGPHCMEGVFRAVWVGMQVHGPYVHEAAMLAAVYAKLLSEKSAS